MTEFDMKNALTTLAILFASSSPLFSQQYQFDDITIPPAAADESIRESFSLEHAKNYLENAALAWNRDRGCVSCHTTGSYMLAAPELASLLGKPNSEIREALVSQLAELKKVDRAKFNSGTRTAQVIYIAAGLAEWDSHVGKALSPETDEALKLMFELQNDEGTWQSLDCWPPFESSSYQEAIVAVMAATTAPNWLDVAGEMHPGMKRLIDYLKKTPPAHDYARVLKLWSSTRVQGILEPAQKDEIIALIAEKQHEDGGWAMRDFAKPEEWGSGNRAGKLRAEPDFDNPPSDGHMTGLATLVLRDAGVPADDPRIKKAVTWLLANQRESGRWWARSLNTDKKHYITHSATSYALLALAKCGALSGAE
ncbi:MAG: squalene-hopene/tetraprenyl-beta-curcumene cyclase [Verrucomicrobiales bacterium]